MAALNEAWFVLGDAGRRAVYDRSLDERRWSGPTAEQNVDEPGNGDGFDGDLAEIDGPPVRTAGYFTGLPWVLVLAALAVIFVFTAYAARGDGEGERDGLVRPGDCVRLRTGHPAEEAPCDEPHDAVVTVVGGSDRPCPQGTQAAAGPVGSPRLCLRPG